MDLRAKQRLTGAVILVALIVLLVPPMLNGPHTAQPPQDSSGEAGLRRYTIDLDSPQSSVRPAPTAPEVALPAVAQNPMSEGGAVPGELAAPAPASQAPASAPTNTVVATAPTVVETPARAATSATPAPRAGGFAVQLGTFEKRENAEGLVRDVIARGFAAFLAPTTKDGRELYRVRVGPTRDRAGAEALAARLERVGHKGSVVPIS